MRQQHVLTVGAALLLSTGGCVFVAGGTRMPTVINSDTEMTPAQAAIARMQILGMMDSSARAWTRGDLDAFVDYYEPGMETTYIGRNGVIRGRAAIREVYAPRFAPGAMHDSLSFEDVSIDVLAPNVANVIAYYRLSRGDSTVARGPTTVVVRRRDGRWRIIHDHSS